MRGKSEASMALTAIGFDCVDSGENALLLRPDEEAGARSSTIVFHSPHSGHLPCHLGDSAPHDVQNHSVCVFFALIRRGILQGLWLWQMQEDQGKGCRVYMAKNSRSLFGGINELLGSKIAELEEGVAPDISKMKKERGV